MLIKDGPLLSLLNTGMFNFIGSEIDPSFEWIGFIKYWRVMALWGLNHHSNILFIYNNQFYIYTLRIFKIIVYLYCQYYYLLFLNNVKYCKQIIQISQLQFKHKRSSQALIDFCI
jgi:hypothetical protein